MKSLIPRLTALSVFALVLSGCKETSPAGKVDYPLTPVPFTQVKLEKGFWKDRMETVSTATIPFAFEKSRETGRIDNFIFAGGIKEGKFRGRYGFDDSDLYKIIEGASYSLMLESDPGLESTLDTLVSYISAAQEENGYLYTAWSLKANEYNEFYCCTYSEEGQWIGTTESSHEFYNAGHMYEAAVAHYQATGKRSFLDVALKNADLVYDVCMVQGKELAPGHQEIELGLVKLYRVSGEQKYLDLARHFLDIRSETGEGEYAQYHLPVTDQREAVGHAVRANYMYSAMADIAALTGDTAYLDAVEALWSNVAGKKLSITGGVGASHSGEAYGENYELPNHPYNETCAAIANVYWNHRMFLLTGEGKYMDVLERALYNGVLPGLSLDGTLFFYPNTLQHDGEQKFNQGVNGRSPWFNCSCCPSNLSRFVPSVAGYTYATRGDQVYVNLYMNSTASLETPGGQLDLTQKTAYPWKGKVELMIENEEPVRTALCLRIPGWASGHPVPSDLFRYLEGESRKPVIRVNGGEADWKEERGFAILDGEWKQGDLVTLELPMETRKVVANEKVEEKTGLVALEYGPLVYCAEETDNQVDVLECNIEAGANFDAVYEPSLLGGVNILHSGELSLVPYYAWNNRGTGRMNVWFSLVP